MTNNDDDIYYNLGLGSSQADFQSSGNNQLLPFGGVDKSQPGLEHLISEQQDGHHHQVAVPDSLFPNTNRVFDNSVP